MPRTKWLPLGAVVLVVNAVQWVVAEAITAAAWTSPPYSYARNYISDLGVADCGTRFQGRELCSPDHALMNTSFMLEGILFATGVLLLAGLVEGRARRVIIALALAHGVGMVLIGLFHGTADGPAFGTALHVGGAGIGILCANTLAILAGALRGLGLPTAYRIFSVTVGALGLVSVALVGVSVSTAGAFERGSVYSWLLWSVVTGALLLARHQHRPAVVENVLA
ncbi:DUF998 domain-containing protein [Streptomyces sp. NBC_00878]|uniref:DUF998 domain-containing protein n=1 Tax=Streptomyces sp. NBC_00878 TaxID=2975854 RepID=UPI0022571D10|nr:DUF998 domain-containing protein [Streptomyces sp. NBC_00878]MCX4911207.1 DUF998 domain-containing protein [Streptomyces sp. NBC_00878]